MTTVDPKSYLRSRLFFYGIFWVMVMISAPFIGGESIHPWSSLPGMLQGNPSVEGEIFLFQRIPRVLLAALVGGSLAVVGAGFQVILRNPLADPYTLGITGGSSVAAVLTITLPGLWVSWGPFSSVQLFSLLGALSSLFLIYSMSRRPAGISMNTLLLAGVTISILSSGLILFIRYLANPRYLVSMDRWMMGGLEVVGYRELSALLPLLLPGLGMLFSCRLELNHLALGEEMASGHGVDVSSVQKRVFWGGALTTAGVVSLAGPIGFVGLIVPHAVRRISGFDHRLVLPAAFLLGGAFLVFCDTLARTLLAPTEMPVGILTALIGGPFFIRMLFTSR